MLQWWWRTASSESFRPARAAASAASALSGQRCVVADFPHLGGGMGTVGLTTELLNLRIPGPPLIQSP